VEKGISEYVIWGGGGKSPIAYAGTEAKAVAKAKKLEAKAQKIQAKLKPVETTPSAVIEATEAKLPAVDITVVGGKQYALEKSNQSIESAPITPEIEKMIVEKFPDKAEEVIKGQQELAIVEVAAEKALSEDFIEVSEKTLEEINAKIGEIEKVLSPEEKIELEAARERKKKMGGPQAFVDTSPGGQTWPVQTFGKTIGGAINYVKQGSLNTWDQLRSAGYNPAKFVGNLGYKDAKLLKDPKLLEINNDFIIDASTAPYKAEQMWKRVFPDGANPSSVLIASMDKFFRRLLRNERSGHNLPFEYNKENLEINRLENKRDLMGDLEAQKMHNELEVNRVEILEMYRKAGMQISDQMMKDPDYFPIKVWDDFSDFAQGTYNTSRKGKPSHLKRARGSDRNIVENLPQVIIEMYIQAMNYLPVQKMLNSVTDPANGFVLVDPVTGKAERPKGKGSVPEGYVRYSLDRFKFYPKEVLDKGKLQEVITLGGKIDLDNLAEKTIGISEVPDLIIKKEAAAYLDRIKAEKDIRHSTLKSATDLWKFYAISQSPVRYLMNNMFSDALAGVILAPRKAQYIRDYNAILPAMYGYYFNGEPATPAINMARDTAMLETGLTSDVFAEAMFESPEMKETREKLFGQSSAIKSAGLNAK